MFARLALLSLLPVPLLAVPALASADVTFGGTRASGMGGAGLALPLDVFQNYRLNPAITAFGGKGFRLQYPQFGYRTDGLDLSDVTDLASDLTSGSGNENLAIRLARRYGGRDRDFGVTAGLGFFGGGFALSGEGEASVASRPNAVLKSFIGSGGDINNAPLDAQLDAYGFGYYQYAIGYANAVQLPKSRLATGIKVKQVRGYYAHKKAFGPSISGNTTGGVVNGSDVPGGEDFRDARAVGVDLGGIYSTDSLEGVYFGAVVENAVRPNVKFDSEAANNGTLRRDFVDPFATIFNFGLGYQYRQNVLLAADLVDIGNRAGRGEFRTGVELGFARAFAGRAGYNSRTGFTYGVAVGGFNVQLGGQQPITIGTTVRF